MAKKGSGNFWQSFAEKIADEDTSMMSEGLGSAEFTGYVDTGCYTLNALVSGNIFGGIPNNSATAFAGDPATGKTFFCLDIMKNFLKDPEAGVAHFETESAVRKSMAEARGIDTTRVIRNEPATLEQFRTKVIELLNAYKDSADRPKLMLVLDSLGMLSSNKEIKDTTEGNDTRDMTKSQLIKGIFRVIRLKMAKLRVPMLITNHVYAGVGLYAPPKVIAGGSGLIYAADTIITLSKKKIKEGDEITGNLIRAKAFKARLARENKEVEMRLDYEKGLDKYHGLLEIAEEGGVIKKEGRQYVLPGGAKAYGKEIDENAAEVYTPDILDAINEVVMKMFMYGSEAKSKLGYDPNTGEVAEG